MYILYIISLILLISGIVLFLISLLFKSNYKYNLKPNNNSDFAVIIPARNESKVITPLLESIKKQIDNMNRVYIIVEDKNDLTCQIANQYKANIIIRKDLSKNRKGFALDEGIEEILKEKEYDLYFIIDADNILEDNFFNEMLDSYHQGYDIAVGYRNIKNGNKVVSSASGFTFSMINSINELKNKYKNINIISGTGFYISGKIINKLRSFPFHSLTEDYEISLYAYINNYSTYYNKKAIFYDEQPTKFIPTIKQRTRWIKGFFEARKTQLKNVKIDNTKLLGLTPYMFIVAGLLLFIFTNLFYTIYYLIIDSSKYIEPLINLSIIVGIIYLIFALFTIVIFIIDKKINLSFKMKVLTTLYNPIFLTTYVICFIKAITDKNVKWDIIEHKEELKKY